MARVPSVAAMRQQQAAEKIAAGGVSPVMGAVAAKIQQKLIVTKKNGWTAKKGWTANRPLILPLMFPRR